MKVFEIDATEEINTKQLKNFFLINLQFDKSDFTHNSYIYYSYVKEFQKYLIIVLDIVDNLLPEILTYDIKQEQLLFSKNFFLLYKNNKPYYFQSLSNNYDKEELISYIKRSFSLDNLTIYEIDKIDKKAKSLDKKLPIIKIKNSSVFKIFLFYSSFVFLFLFYLQYEQQIIKSNELSNIKETIFDIKQDSNFEYLSKKLVKLDLAAKNNSVEIVSYILKNSKISIQLKTDKKENIYDFLKLYESSSLENISYDKNQKRYITNAIFRLY